MNIYEQKNYWKILLLLTLLLIIIASILYTNYLAGRLAAEEKKKVELLADVFRRLNPSNEIADYDFLLKIIQSNETVPLILTDEEDHILGYRIFDSVRIARDSNYLKNELAEMKAARAPIDIEYSKDSHQYIYYRDSYLLTQLKYFPYIQFSIILLFIGVAYLTFSTARRAEQNRVWVGMAKETAHQLGTPITALSGWVEHMRMLIKDGEAAASLPEIEKDIARLELIAERFSKIGSSPVLDRLELTREVELSIEYIRRRASQQVSITVNSHGAEKLEARISPPLFAWVMENLLKNALDAIGGSGSISISILKQGRHAIIDVKDSGKGIASGKFKTVFRPGYSTKKRGWGLGLSLAKRIIEEYHGGKIFVKESSVGKGTTFRIVLRS